MCTVNDSKQDEYCTLNINVTLIVLSFSINCLGYVTNILVTYTLIILHISDLLWLCFKLYFSTMLLFKKLVLSGWMSNAHLKRVKIIIKIKTNGLMRNIHFQIKLLSLEYCTKMLIARTSFSINSFKKCSYYFSLLEYFRFI